LYQPTTRNHYNPCFWVALWNDAYFREWQATSSPPARHAREQAVWVLNLRSDRIYESKVECVHFQKGFGLAEISPASMLDWCKHWHPAEAAGLAEHLRQHPEPLYLDFEPTLHGLEQLHGYQAIMDAARNERILSAAHKGFLACGLMMHAMRSYEFSTSMLQPRQGRQPGKWQYLWLLKTAWANELVLARSGLPLAMGQWTLWRTAEPAFPLCDSPIFIHRDGLVALLSPRLLLEIDLTVARPEDHWILRDEVLPKDLDVFYGALLNNSFKELVAWDRATLERWRRDPRYRIRVEALSSPERRDAAIAEAAERVVWGMMGFGRVPDDFEQWASAARDKALQSDKGRALLSELRPQSARRHGRGQSRQASADSTGGEGDT
jgi:hypothetical protein